MKKIIFAVLSAFALVTHADDDFDFVESNVTVEKGPLAYTFRTYFKDDYDHHEIKYTFASGLVAGFRYAEDQLSGVGAINGDPEYDLMGIDVGDAKQWEYRPYIEYVGFSWNVTDRWSFRARPRIELRMFDIEDDIVTERDDYARFRAGAWTEYKLTDKITPWASVDFYNNISDMEFEQSRYQAGVNFQIMEGVSVGPYLETRLDDNFNANYTMLATQLKVSF